MGNQRARSGRPARYLQPVERRQQYARWAPPPPQPTDPRALVKDLKRVVAVAAALTFGGFWALAASHQVGVTNASSSTAQVRSVSGSGSAGSSSVSVPLPRHSQLSSGGSSGPVLRSGSS